MRLQHIVILAFSLVFRLAWAANNDTADFVALASVPPQALEALNKPTVASQYAISTQLNPFYVQGDFDGDGKLDCAILVRNKASGKLGIAIVHAGKPGVSVLGAGTAFGSGGDDFAWMDAWYVYPRGQVSKGASGAAPPKLKGDGLMLIKTEASSGLAYWTGAQYKWYQQGD